MSKKQLSIILSKLKVFEKPLFDLEQYPTDSEIAADALWQAKMLEDIDEKEIADLMERYGHTLMVDAIRQAADQIRRGWPDLRSANSGSSFS